MLNSPDSTAAANDAGSIYNSDSVSGTAEAAVGPSNLVEENSFQLSDRDRQEGQANYRVRLFLLRLKGCFYED